MNCLICEGKSCLVWKERQYRAYRCRKCRIVFLYPLPANPSIIYNEDYFRKWYIKYYSRRKAYVGELFSDMEKQVGRKGKLLDVGCGAGILMEVAGERGWDVCGQDVSPFAVDYCRQKGFKVYNSPLPELDIPGNSFDLITLFDVIAHLKDPVSYIRSCSRLLKPGGSLVIKTPYHPPYLFLTANLFSFTGKSRGLLHVPAQIFHFQEDSLDSITGKFEFESPVCLITREFFVVETCCGLKPLSANLLKMLLSRKTILAIIRKRDE